MAFKSFPPRRIIFLCALIAAKHFLQTNLEVLVLGDDLDAGGLAGLQPDTAVPQRRRVAPERVVARTALEWDRLNGQDRFDSD